MFSSGLVWADIALKNTSSDGMASKTLFSNGMALSVMVPREINFRGMAPDEVMSGGMVLDGRDSILVPFSGVLVKTLLVGMFSEKPLSGWVIV